MTAQPQPSLLFVQTAQKIDYKDGVMTLFGVPFQTVFFTDRPYRVAGHLPTDEFVAKWTTDTGPNSFAKDPPNAAVTVRAARHAVCGDSGRCLGGTRTRGSRGTGAGGLILIDTFQEFIELGVEQRAMAHWGVSLVLVD
jgi:hypothetical protein